MGNSMLGGIKAIDIGEEITCSVANPTVGITGATQNLIRDRHLATKVSGGNPQTQHIGAHLIDDFLRGNYIADGLGHLATMFINSKSMGQHGLIRGCSIDRDSGLQ